MSGGGRRRVCAGERLVGETGRNGEVAAALAAQPADAAAPPASGRAPLPAAALALRQREKREKKITNQGACWLCLFHAKIEGLVEIGTM